MYLYNDVTTQDLLGVNALRISREDLRSAPECAALLTESGRIDLVSQALSETFGFEDDALLVGRTWCKVWPSELHAALYETLRRAWDGKLSTYWAHRCNAAGLQEHWDVRVSPVFDQSGQVKSVLALYHPVTAH